MLKLNHKTVIREQDGLSFERIDLGRRGYFWYFYCWLYGSGEAK